MNKTTKCVIGAMMALFLCIEAAGTAYASDGQEYITISVEAEDNSGVLLYALDTDAPDAFTPSNEFTVPAGTSHTIYVKDQAGNVTSQEFAPEEPDNEDDGDMQTVNIDITLDDTPAASPEPDDTYEYAGDLLYDPAEQGQGTVYEKIQAPANDPDAERIFYTVTTDEGEVFYLVIDQGQSSNNVYLLDQVNLSDLRALAYDDSGESGSKESSSLLSVLSGSGNNEGEDLLETEETNLPTKGNSKGGNIILLLLIAAAGGGFYYYKNVYKNKKDEQMDLIDALDKEDFAAEDEEDEEEIDFGLDEGYQERILQQLINEDVEEDFENSLDMEPSSTQETEGASGSIIEEISSSEPSYKEEIFADEEEYDEELDSPDDEEDE